MPSRRAIAFVHQPPNIATVKYLLLAVIAFAASGRGQVLPPEARIVMSHFKSDGGGGDERLYISCVAYTSGTYGRGTKFGLVKSSDLLNWTFVTSVDATLAGAPDQFTWSPIFFEDGDGSVHVIVAISPTNGSTFYPVPDMRVHEMHPTNAAWTQWSVPVPLQLPDTNNNDCWVWKEGTTYHAAYADFSRGGAVVHATSQDLVVGWVRDKVLGYNSQEGNIVLPIPGGGYRLYLERGNGPGGTPTTYTTADFSADFTNPTPQTLVNSSIPIRNGKVCAVRNAVSYNQWQANLLAGVPAALRTPGADADDDGLANVIEHVLTTNPIVPTAAANRPQPYASHLADGLHPGIRFDFLRASSDVLAAAEARSGSGTWSSPAMTVESLTLVSDGTTRVHARTNAPLANQPALLRVAATQAAAARTSKLPSSAKSSRPRSIRRLASPWALSR